MTLLCYNTDAPFVPPPELQSLCFEQVYEYRTTLLVILFCLYRVIRDNRLVTRLASEVFFTHTFIMFLIRHDPCLVFPMWARSFFWIVSLHRLVPAPFASYKIWAKSFCRRGLLPTSVSCDVTCSCFLC